MSYDPASDVIAPLIITPYSYESLGAELVGSGAGGPVSAIWNNANRAYYIPFSLRTPTVLRKLFWTNGTTAAGNLDMGVYASTDAKPGALLVSTGSTAQSGNNTLQVTDIADLMLSASTLYYMGMAANNGSTAVYRTSIPSANILTMLGVCQATSAFPLAANPTIETVAAANMWVFGLVFDTSVIL